ncbi:hypothetical protein [Streptomyces sp. CA-111067]|uniref:hypothetical protein n=1 Tax=Streptomyces sp. CA-111067 TaxID=3240046 RepID=UPI003D999246
MDQNQPGGGVEDVLSETLHAHAELAPPASSLLDAVAARAARRRIVRRRAALLGVVTAVVVAGGTGAFVAADRGGHGGPDATTAERVTHLAGQSARAWNFQGLEVDAPENWAMNATECGSPLKDTVVVDQGATTACAMTGPQRFQSVTFDTLKGSSAGSEAKRSTATRKVVISGRPGTVATQRATAGLTREILTVPGLDASVDVQTKSPTLTAAIIASARFAAVDGNGCASSVTSLRPGGPPDRAGAADRLVPGAPTGAVLCHYSDNRLGHSTRLSDGRLGELRSLLNGLSPGLKRSGGEGDWCADDARDGYLVVFSYPSGPPLKVFLHFDGCDRLGADSGARTGGLTGGFAEGFYERIEPGFGGAWPGTLY